MATAVTAYERRIFKENLIKYAPKLEKTYHYTNISKVYVLLLLSAVAICVTTGLSWLTVKNAFMVQEEALCAICHYQKFSLCASLKLLIRV